MTAQIQYCTKLNSTQTELNLTTTTFLKWKVTFKHKLTANVHSPNQPIRLTGSYRSMDLRVLVGYTLTAVADWDIGAGIDIWAGNSGLVTALGEGSINDGAESKGISGTHSVVSVSGRLGSSTVLARTLSKGHLRIRPSDILTLKDTGPVFSWMTPGSQSLILYHLQCSFR